MNFRKKIQKISRTPDSLWFKTCPALWIWHAEHGYHWTGRDTFIRRSKLSYFRSVYFSICPSWTGLFLSGIKTCYLNPDSRICHAQRSASAGFSWIWCAWASIKYKQECIPTYTFYPNKITCCITLLLIREIAKSRNHMNYHKWSFQRGFKNFQELKIF